MSKASHLLIVAHPDDETIFFGGTIMSLKNRKWRVVVVTDGNADGQGETRRHQLADACKEMGVRDFEQWDFADDYEKRLNIDRLISRFEKEDPRIVFTHGIIGEYGHPHHQDVSYAVHKHFRGKVPIWSAAYNSFATKDVRLTRKIYERKAKIFSQVYQSETLRFARVLPVRNHEGFHQLDWPEVEHLYSFFTNEINALDLSLLKTYRWFAPYLFEQKKVAQKRRF